MEVRPRRDKGDVEENGISQDRKYEREVEEREGKEEEEEGSQIAAEDAEIGIKDGDGDLRWRHTNSDTGY